MTRIKIILTSLLLAFAVSMASATAPEVATADNAEKKINPKKIIFEHLLDGYGWEVPFDHHHRIPLPVIVRASDG